MPAESDETPETLPFGGLSLDIASLAGLLEDVMAVLHELAPDRMQEILRARAQRLSELSTGRIAPDFTHQKTVEKNSLELLEAALSPGRRARESMLRGKVRPV
mgnify:CR=1 FL=1